MSLGNTFENDLVKLLFQATAIANLADNAASSPLTDLYLSLYTSDPGEAGDQTTNECAYTSYARVAVARSSSGWDVSGAVASLHALTSFPQATGGSETATYFGVGTDATGTGKLLVSGAISPSIAISAGVTPQLTTATTVTFD